MREPDYDERLRAGFEMLRQDEDVVDESDLEQIEARDSLEDDPYGLGLRRHMD